MTAGRTYFIHLLRANYFEKITPFLMFIFSLLTILLLSLELLKK